MKFEFNVGYMRVFLNDMMYSTKVAVVTWTSNLKKIATYDYKVHQWSNSVPDEVFNLYTQDCCCCHSHRNRNEQVLIKIDNDYMMIGNDCLDMLDPSVWLKEYAYLNINEESLYVDSEDVKYASESFNLMPMEKFVDVFAFIKTYKKIYATSSMIRSSFNAYTTLYADSVVDNFKYWVIDNEAKKNASKYQFEAIQFLEYYANSNFSETDEYNYSIMMIARDVLQNADNCIHRNAIPMMITAIYSYIENEIYKSSSTSELDTVNTTVVLMSAKLQNSKFGSKYKYCFMDEAKNLFVYYTTKEIPESVGHMFTLKCKTFEFVTERGVKVIRLKRAIIKEI